MKVRKRDSSLGNTRHIKQDKIRVILEWILEFRFSNYDILSERLGLTVKHCRRFFKQITEEGVVQEFRNVHTRGDLYLMLTATGASYLQGDGHAIEGAITSPSKLTKYATLIHDLSVQKVALQLIEQYGCDELIWDRNIEVEGQIRPDLLFHSPEGFWGALEYERWSKKENRIYTILQAHCGALAEKRYSAVFYCFADKSDLVKYEKWFSKPEWPVFKKNKQGRLKLSSEKYKPDPQVRKLFKFEYRPVLDIQ